MDERVKLPPLPPLEPDESAEATLLRELCAELDGLVLQSKLRTASGVFPLLHFPHLQEDARRHLEETKQRVDAAREQNKQRAAPLDGAVAEAIFATALHDWPDETARRMSAIGLNVLHEIEIEIHPPQTQR